MKLKTAFIFAFLTLFTGILVSCDNDNGNNPVICPPAQPQPDEEETEKPTDFKYIELTSAQRDANASTQKFAYDMLRKSVEQANLIDPDGNVFISPLGFSNILTMLANGADNETLEEITAALGANLDNLNSFYSLLADVLPQADNQVKFSTVNSLWVDEKFNPAEDYMNFLYCNFNADSFKVNLNTNETKEAINQWCADKTKGMIPQFLKEPLSDCQMFLVNALYFNGKWHAPFDAEKTDLGKFFSSNGKTSEVEMMHGVDGVEYNRLSKGELVTLFYGNKTYAFNIYLPTEGISIEEVLASSDRYMGTTHGDRACYLTLPKFELQYENDKLKDIGEQMGISRLFTTHGSLSKIADDLYCGFMKQVAKIKVNEAGAEAAAVTGAGVFNSTGEIISHEPVTVNVNRPFIFSITETTHDIILFAGMVRNL
ncbi:MAG: hypothetical protein K2H96_07460 [Muribaculaceae bacterium]|nr:hypothetical protein [Muribaculaceae bacterium]